MSTCLVGRLSDVDVSSLICKIAWHSKNPIKCFHFSVLWLEATEDQEPFWSLPPIVGIFIYCFLELFVKIWVWESSKDQSFCLCDFSIERKQVSLWHVLLEQFMGVYVWDSSLQLISHALQRLNRLVKCKMVTPIKGTDCLVVNSGSPSIVEQ